MKKSSLYISTFIITSILIVSCVGDESNQGSFSNEVTIGDQVWMTKNLNVDKFRNGDPIPEAKTNEEWRKAGNNRQPVWSYYDNDPANGEKYGKLYNWYAVIDSRGLAPKGWYVPSNEEWITLNNHLGGRDVAGKKMKSTSGWSENFGKNGNGSNKSGFSGLPGGYRNFDGTFDYVGRNGYWWSSDENFTLRIGIKLNYYSDFSELIGGSYSNGHSVRVIRSNDEEKNEETFNEKVSYDEVTIGDQVWMAENLNVARFRNGDPIPEAKTNKDWTDAARNRKPAWSYYNNDPANGQKYGRLYNWHALHDPRGLAPEGWKIPDQGAWIGMSEYLRAKGDAGKKMKSTSGWSGTYEIPEYNGTNESGFSGLPGGLRLANGSFEDIGTKGYWWSLGQWGVNDGYFSYLEHYSNNAFWHYGMHMGTGMSVRCIKE